MILITHRLRCHPHPIHARYKYVDDILERRGEFRDAHLSLALQAQREGRVVFGGAFADPVDQALIVFKADSSDDAADWAAAFVAADPYVLNGLVTEMEVRQWSVVVGDI